MRAAWQWRNAPFLTSLKRGVAPAEFTTGIRGTFDAIESAPPDLGHYSRPGILAMAGRLPVTQHHGRWRS